MILVVLLSSFVLLFRCHGVWFDTSREGAGRKSIGAVWGCLEAIVGRFGLFGQASS